MSKLKIIETNEKNSGAPSRSDNGRVEREALFERRWLQNPEQFNPAQNALLTLQEERLFANLPQRNGQKALDIGPGWGNTTLKLIEQGWQVDALEISSHALKHLKSRAGEKVRLIKGTFPMAPLDEGSYDLILAANIIAELPEVERRLAVSEIASLLTPGGLAVLSTPIDIYSEDGVIRFLRLLETEFDISKVVFSYFYLPEKFTFLKKYRYWVEKGEKISKFLWQDTAITNVIALCQLKALVPSHDVVQERALKKTVWE